MQRPLVPPPPGPSGSPSPACAGAPGTSSHDLAQCLKIQGSDPCIGWKYRGGEGVFEKYRGQKYRGARQGTRESENEHFENSRRRRRPESIMSEGREARHCAGRARASSEPPQTISEVTQPIRHPDNVMILSQDALLLPEHYNSGNVPGRYIYFLIQFQNG